MTMPETKPYWHDRTSTRYDNAAEWTVILALAVAAVWLLRSCDQPEAVREPLDGLMAQDGPPSIEIQAWSEPTPLKQ